MSVERVKAIADVDELLAVDFLDKAGRICGPVKVKVPYMVKKVRLTFKSHGEITIKYSDFVSLGDYKFTLSSTGTNQ